MVKRLTNECYRVHLNQVESSWQSDPKKFWSYVNSKKGNSRIPGRMFTGDDQFESPQEIVDAFASYFSSVYINPVGPTNLSSDTCNIIQNIHIAEFTEDDVISSLRKLKCGFTAGDDLIPAFFVKDCSHTFVTPLLRIFNLILKTAEFPDIWKITRVTPVFKSGDASNISNYRPIALLSNFAKAFEICLYSRIYPLSLIHI